MNLSVEQQLQLLRRKFQLAVEYSKSPEAKKNGGLDTSTQLSFYSLFKQATEGACTGPRPSMVKFVERTKYDMWKELGDMNSADAMIEYLKEMDKAQPDWKKVVKHAETIKFRSKL